MFTNQNKKLEKNENHPSRRKINREYLLGKSLLFIGAFDEVSRLITIFQKAFKKFESSYDIAYITKNLAQYDVIFCLEDTDSLEYLKAVRALDQDIPYLILSNKQFRSSATMYIEDKLSHYIQSGLENVDIMFILQHQLQNYDVRRKNKDLLDKNKVYLEMLDKFVIVSRTDLEGKITYVNDIFCEVNKFSREELIGQAHSITKDPSTSPAVFKDLWDTITRDEIWEGTLSNKDKEGELYIAKMVIFPFCEGSVKVGYMAIRYVVTAEINQNKQLKSYILKTIVNLKKELTEENVKHKLELEDKMKKIHYLEILADRNSLDEEKAFQKKIASQASQIESYDEKLKYNEALHQRRIAEYLKEKREHDSIVSENKAHIVKLENQAETLQTKISDLENLVALKKEIITNLQKEIAIQKDLVEHRESQIEKLQAK